MSDHKMQIPIPTNTNKLAVTYKSILKTSSMFFVIFAIAFTIGFLHLERTPTDPSAEKQALEDAISIIKGNSRYGIVEYCHYPNGPTYILLPFLFFNPSLQNYHLARIIPLFISALALTLLIAYFLSKAKSWKSAIWTVMAFIVLLTQPGIVNWFGALHKQAYEMAIVMFVIYAGLKFEKIGWIYGVTGFVAGWIGYDFCLSQLFVMFMVRLLYYSDPYERWLNPVMLKKISLESFLGFAGIVAAVVLHIIQNALFFDSFALAFRDLVGAGMVRMYMDNGLVINDDYLKWLKHAAEMNYNPNPFSESGNFISQKIKQFFIMYELIDSRLFIVTFMFYAFLKLFASPISLLLLFLSAVFINASYHKALKKQPSSIGHSVLKTFRINLVVYFIFGFIGSISWYLVMKYHAQFHYHFLPRMYFVLIFLMIAFIHRAFEKKDELCSIQITPECFSGK